MHDPKPFVARAEEHTESTVTEHAAARLDDGRGGRGGLLCVTDDVIAFVEEDLLEPGAVTTIDRAEVSDVSVDAGFLDATLRVTAGGKTTAFSRVDTEAAERLAAAMKPSAGAKPKAKKKNRPKPKAADPAPAADPIPEAPRSARDRKEAAKRASERKRAEKNAAKRARRRKRAVVNTPSKAAAKKSSPKAKPKRAQGSTHATKKRRPQPAQRKRARRADAPVNSMHGDDLARVEDEPTQKELAAARRDVWMLAAIVVIVGAIGYGVSRSRGVGPAGRPLDGPTAPAPEAP